MGARVDGCADLIGHTFGAQRACDGFCASAGCDPAVLFCGFVALGFGVRALAGDGLGKLAGLPEQEDLLQAVEDAREDGGDQGVEGFGQHSPISPRRGRAGFAQAGDLSAEGGGLD